MGPVTWGETTFAEGRGRVNLNWTSPGPGAVPYGAIHTHNPGGHLPSGNLADPNFADLGVLNYIAGQLSAAGRPTQHARIYIAADTLVGADETQETQINIYTQSNIEAALGQELLGPEVNPEGQPCPS